MTKTISIVLGAETKRRLDSSAERSQRSKSVLAAEAIVQHLDAEDWQLEEIEAGIADLDAGRTVSHDHAKAWLESWGSGSERTPPT